MNRKYGKISIIGAGISGIGAAKTALDSGAKVFISDGKECDKLKAELKEAKLLDKVEFESGGQSEKIYDSDLIVVSPAVWRSSPIFEEAVKRNVEIIGELEFAYQNSRCRWIGITGSTGKSTTSAIINAIFDETDIPHCLCGNIGFSAAKFAPKLPENGIAICEISSFQLETIKEFSPNIAVILNLYPNHLDRHKDLDEYYNTKMKISQNLKSDGLIITTSDNETLKNWAKTGNKHLFYNEAQNLLIERIKTEIKIPGTHNVFNAVIGFETAKFFGVDDEKIFRGISKFTGLEHRMEFTGEKNGVKFYNDSKSTTGESMLAAISGFPEKSVHLIAGGKDKGVLFESYKDTVYKQCANVLAIGQASQRIKNCWGEIVIECETMQNAVNTAIKSGKSGDAVVLSPACASFDQFSCFEDRGEKFREMVKKL
jgi:UDP-N-acetylmuramoylalanine--D-glutamate ligase